MNKNKINFFLITLTIIIIIFLIFNFLPNKFSFTSDISKTTNNNNITIKIVRGNSMEPLIKDNQSIKVIENYFEHNNSILKEDIILIKKTYNNNPLIKKVIAIPNDEIKFNENNILFVNRQKITNSKNKKYIFQDNEIKLIKLYLNSNNILSKGYLVLGDNINNSKDSRTFGAVPKEEIIGKVILE